ncbi:MAG: hypothetical protein U0169_17645 [Polyangiaceae bacterium]
MNGRSLVPFALVVTALACGTFALHGCKSEEVRVANLEFREVDGGVSGFTCAEAKANLLAPATPPLAQRTMTRCGGNGRVTFVADLVSMAGGNPRCSPASIGEWCDSHDCSPVASSRVCLERDVFDATSAEAAMTAVSRELRALSGSIFTADAPDVSAIIRVVATTQTCDELKGKTRDPFDCTKLVGCTYSCPVSMGSLSGPVDMQLDLGLNIPALLRIYDQICLEGVYVCARTPFGTKELCTSREPPACTK